MLGHLNKSFVFNFDKDVYVGVIYAWLTLLSSELTRRSSESEYKLYRLLPTYEG